MTYSNNNRQWAINLKSKQRKKVQQQSRFDETKQSFIDKLKCYQQLSDVSRMRQNEQEIRRNAQRIKQRLAYQVKSPRNDYNNRSQSLGKTTPIIGINMSVNNKSNKLLVTSNNIKTNTNINPNSNNNRSQQNKQHYSQSPSNSPLSPSPSLIPSLSLINTKLSTQQQYFNQQIQKIVTQLSTISNKYTSSINRHQQQQKTNYMQLDNFQKYLITSQKQYQVQYNMVVDKSKQQIQSLITQQLVHTRTLHKTHLQSSLNTIHLIDNQCHLLNNGIINQSQLCQSQWCKQLDIINDQILELNNFITQVRLQQIDRYNDQQWRVKQIKFGCEDMIQREKKERLQQEHKIYAVIEHLIQKVALPT